MAENFRILKGLPAYGDLYVSIPQNGYKEFSEGFVIEFLAQNGHWVGNFQLGSSNLKFVAQLDENEMLVIADGTVYLVDVNSKRELLHFGFHYDQVLQYDRFFILVDDYSIDIVKNSSEIKRFKDLSLDGISGVKIQKRKLTGISHDFDGYGKSCENQFSIDLETFEFKKHKPKWWRFW
ncbi:MAG: hypothetical protein EOO50_04850 [Flavobacterium sp.]|uniref:hypothetical protein n=1 Tax=Flavobacterium sp. TaxID=239 RepID=UPI0012160A2B|nr:hypothetical protein [Flavobacterium sp.]RZJ67611.1 MAG: hypothetical protein EOO50_04850 [Flavobacterium sp.]